MPNTSLNTRSQHTMPLGKIALAPMEGVVDFHVRKVLTEIGGIDFCVTEFMRVTTQLQPRKIFYKLCPELSTDAQTAYQVPVHYQLLGNHPELLAQHAVRAATLGAKVVDLNFGCPAKTVNKHKGGAVLLQTPHEIFEIVRAVAQALAPTPARLTAKMRLGYEDKRLVFENLAAIQEAGATELVVHARTKVEGYKPPAHWQWLARIKEKATIPIIANGEIWSPEDYHRCREVSGCEDVMIGRGLLADPFLAQRIKHHILDQPSIADLASVLHYFLNMIRADMPEIFVLARGKQWSNMMRKHSEEACDLFDQVKRCSDADSLMRLLEQTAQQPRYFQDLFAYQP